MLLSTTSILPSPFEHLWLRRLRIARSAVALSLLRVSALSATGTASVASFVVVDVAVVSALPAAEADA